MSYTNTINVLNKLDAPHNGQEWALYNLIAVKAGIDSSSKAATDLSALWSQQWWGLNNSSTFQNLPAEKQVAALAACNYELLKEAYFIEKSGLAYCAKMTLSADCTDVAQLYALIGADEAKHLAWIEPYISDPDKTSACGQFLTFLSKLIEELPPNLLVYLVQIILEGWGLDHYSRLSRGCEDNHLSQTLSAILKDEALHHRSGTLLFDPAKLSPEDRHRAKWCLETYTDMVRVGPITAVSAIDIVAEGLKENEIEDLLIALNHAGETTRKLLLLKELMQQHGMEDLVRALDKQQRFLAIPTNEAARLYCHHRSDGQTQAG